MTRLLVWISVLFAQALPAQTMEIRLRDQTTLAPVVGAIVRLLNDRDVAVAQGLSNGSGWIALRSRAAGSYRLKVDRIGWTSVVAGPFTLGAGETIRRELRLSSDRLELPALTVEGESGCERTSQGGALAVALWEEIRKALTASLLSGAGQLLPVHVREFSRNLDLSGRPLHEHLVVSRVFPRHTYSALSPGFLAREGFIFPSGDRTMYAAPDAQSLLSDEFVANHCFRAVPGAGTLVGLAFEPARDRKVIDVRGTLWVDRTTSELDYLEYRYTRLPDPLTRADLGGRVSFRRLPSGDWFVSAWHIRGPQLLREEFIGLGNTTRLRTKLLGYHDRGARVEIAADSAGRITRAFVRGRIHDSIAGAGLRDVMVYIEGLGDSIATDSMGRFELAVADTGIHVLAARHRRVGLLGLPSQIGIMLTPGDTALAEFPVPSRQTVTQALCGPAWKFSMLAGILIKPDSTPAPGLELRIAWRAPTGERFEHRTTTGPQGEFAFCTELPVERSLPIKVYEGKRPVMEFPVRVTGDGVAWAELRLSP